MKKLAPTIIVLLFLGIFLCGCQDQTQSTTKQSRLVGDENIRLKKELQQCKAETAKQIDLLQQSQQENAKAAQEAAKSTEFLMDIHLEATKENDSLKARITELQAKLGENNKTDQ